MQRFYYQPPWIDFSIFWGAVVASLGLSIILQMEFGAYDGLYWPAAGLAAVVLVVVLAQTLRLQLTLTAKSLQFGRVFASNRLEVPLSGITEARISAHTVTLQTHPYGKISFVRVFKMRALAAALAKAGVAVTRA